MESPIKKEETELTSCSIDMTSLQLAKHECCDQLVSSSERQAETTKARKSVNCSGKEEDPDKKITVLAVALALLNKAASGLRTLNFIWATVVILGGFAPFLKKTDFWFVTFILVVQGSLMWGRSRREELAARASYLDCKKLKFIILCPYLIAECLALPCVILASYRLEGQNYGSRNNVHQNPALTIFYALFLAEALLILFILWQKPVSWLALRGKLHGKLSRWMNAEQLVSEVNKKYGFDDSEHRTVRRFFYHTYSRCISRSLFDGLKMEFASYSVALLLSSAVEERLAGTKVVSALVESDEYKLKTMRTIETTGDVFERLIHMLSGENQYEPEIRNAAAKITSELMKKKHNRIRLTAIFGSMEYIESLLNENERDWRQCGSQSPHGLRNKTR